MNRLVILLLCSALVACGDDGITFDPEVETYTLFRGTLDEWIPEAVGLSAGSSFDVTPTQSGARYDIDALEPGGQGVLIREYVVTAGVDYVVSIDMVVESSDGVSEVEPWSIVVGTAAEGADFAFTNVFSTQTTAGTAAQAIPLFGNVAVRSGPPQGSGGTEARVRVAVGFRPETADQRTYLLREARIRIVPEDDL